MSIVDEFMELKEDTTADLLAMQVGDFYEFFGEDARTASKELGLKVSEKSSHGSSYPMAGVPIKDLEGYVETLVDEKGYTVAVADQYKEDGNHKRSISRIVTPGTLLEDTGDPRYLCSVTIGSSSSGVAFTDITSGEIVAKEMDIEETVDEIAVYDPSETILTLSTYDKDDVEEMESKIESYTGTVLRVDEEVRELSDLEDCFREEFGDQSVESLQISDSDLAVAAVGRILQYLDETKTAVHESITNVREIGDSKYASVDARTRHSLEITETMGYESGNSLFEVIDHTVTSVGRKRLKKYIQRPLVSREVIEERQRSVTSLVDQGYYRRQIRDILESFPNVSRIASKSAYGTATPREVRQIVDAVDKLQELKSLLRDSDSLRNSPLYENINSLDSAKIKKIKNLVVSSVRNDAGTSVEIGTIRRGYNENLDEVIEEYESNREWLKDLETDISDEYDITHLSVDRNQTDGYYIQVGNSETQKVPDHMNQIKSLKNSVRYKTEDLRKKENDIVRLEERRKEMESEVFEKVLDSISSSSETLQSISDAVAHLDAVQSLSTHAVKNGWTKPEIEDLGGSIDIDGGRHPIVEGNVDFTSNDVDLNSERKFLIVTGPNMSGKSTYLKQVALICLLAQIGSYVPCESANIGIVDSIFARIGSVDEISRGRSTFMVEMSELANILHSSTDNSLVILDEVGRGTATYDGISIAKSTVEYLAQDDEKPSPKTLFATHYHELTDMSNGSDSVQNLHLPIESTRNGREFTHKVKEGSASKSYGIHVADMAGIPEDVVDRSRDILDNLRDDEGEQ